MTVHQRMPNPYGKPVNRQKRTERGYWRIPDVGFSTPRLNSSTTNAIGFVQNLPNRNTG